jgi:hypothetical protein
MPIPSKDVPSIFSSSSTSKCSILCTLIGWDLQGNGVDYVMSVEPTCSWRSYVWHGIETTINIANIDKFIFYGDSYNISK